MQGKTNSIGFKYTNFDQKFEKAIIPWEYA